MSAVRVGICVLVAFAVLAHGAVEPWSIATLEIGAALLFLFWGTLVVRERRVEILWNWLYVPLLGLGGFALVQSFFGLTAYPYVTNVELLKSGTYLLLFFLTVETFRTSRERMRFAWFLVVLGFLVSLLGIVQHFTFNGKLYWFRVLPEGEMPFGPFVNPNHFAGFVELTVPIGLAMLLSSVVRRDKVPLLVFLTVLPIGALVLSASRGGITSFLFELVLLAFLMRKERTRSKRFLMASGLVLAAGFLAIWLGLGWTVERFENLTRGDISRNRRISVFKDTWQIFRHHPWTGTGLGTLEAVYPRYETYYDGLVVDHAHNDYLELLSDTGLVGGVFILGFVTILVWRGLANLRGAKSPLTRSLYSAPLVACAGLLLHSTVDFNLHIPSNALLFFLLSAMATCHVAEPERSYPQAPLF